MRPLVLAALLAAWPAHADPAWHETVSPHFQVFHEDAFVPQGMVLALEKLHNRLRMDLSMFSPWMVKERAKIYLYAGQKSYAAGQFQPPAWSNGIAFYKARTVAAYDQADRRKLFEILAHETTHLLFESYWGEVGKMPPQWLNEGLSMMEENDEPRSPEKSDWYQTMLLMRPERAIPISKFVELRPTTDIKDKETVSLWYVQAYSLVYFLYRDHSRLQFLNFCARMRDGKPFESALWEVYRYSDPQELEKAWKRWLRKKALAGVSARPRADSSSRSESNSRGGDRGKLQPSGFKEMGFSSMFNK